jgi:hypothetical protein
MAQPSREQIEALKSQLEEWQRRAARLADSLPSRTAEDADSGFGPITGDGRAEWALRVVDRLHCVERACLAAAAPAEVELLVDSLIDTLRRFVEAPDPGPEAPSDLPAEPQPAPLPDLDVELNRLSEVVSQFDALTTEMLDFTARWSGRPAPAIIARRAPPVAPYQDLVDLCGRIRDSVGESLCARQLTPEFLKAMAELDEWRSGR